MNTYITEIELDQSRPNGSTHVRVLGVDYIKNKILFVTGKYPSLDEWVQIESARCDIIPGMDGDLLGYTKEQQIAGIKTSIEASY